MTNQQSPAPISFIQNILVARWRSLLLLLAGVYLPLQIFELLAVKLWQYEAGFPWDLPILLAVHSTAQPALDIVAVVLTKFGSFWTVGPILGMIAIVLWQRKRWRSLAYLLTTALGSTIINRTAKMLMHRVRPQLWVSGAPEFDFAFPSGHATTSMTLVAMLLILTWATSWRWLVLTVGSLYILVIGWTRLYLGVHFPSDILAGWMVAIAWAIGVSIIIKPNLTKPTAVGDQTQEETTLLPEET
ncbi:phosphatase PAP2 family protein [Anabaena azotica]|uniref:Phosphatase PAP2 family protein n=1 Tax=Anabaena azotica FACHB-119 TaxID=947527 RepID=A0ABR8D7H3_9NOST|nr:phosphatase PAP2 family protein [Anabaena azotica]MBD2502639.1 phosphatase PAP2 family protein [Anabaena azotica FACHB-119]